MDFFGLIFASRRSIRRHRRPDFHHPTGRIRLSSAGRIHESTIRTICRTYSRRECHQETPDKLIHCRKDPPNRDSPTAETIMQTDTTPDGRTRAADRDGTDTTPETLTESPESRTPSKQRRKADNAQEAHQRRMAFIAPYKLPQAPQSAGSHTTA